MPKRQRPPRKTKSRTDNVRGIIIAKQTGLKPWAAADGHDAPVEFLEYTERSGLHRVKST
jgi:hypothetical protein